MTYYVSSIDYTTVIYIDKAFVAQRWQSNKVHREEAIRYSVVSVMTKWILEVKEAQKDVQR